MTDRLTYGEIARRMAEMKTLPAYVRLGQQAVHGQ